MARRRSLNRRWSRRSINATELDQDSEFFDEDNPVWWKNLPDASTLRPSAHTSFAETTVPNLTPNSLVNDSELEDRWWDNLDRTSLQSSRRFSARKSINPEEVVAESFVSEGDEDVIIKKRKVLIRAREKRSVGTENFLKAFDDSDVAHSEPVPSKKRKTQSPARSEADLRQRNIRTRHSRSLREQRNSSLDTSNDTDIVIKARPKAFKKQVTQLSSDVYDEILSHPGTSGINTSKNASRIQTPVKTIDSSDSGFMRPPVTGSHRKRLSTVAKTLNLTSDESEGHSETGKSRRDFRLKSKENASFNPFDEILSGQLNESTASADAPNKSRISSNAAMRMSKSLKQNQSLQVSVRKDKEDENEATTNEWNVPETQEVPDELEKNSTVIEESVIDENSPESQNRDRRSSSVVNENARRTRDATSDWIVPETQEDVGRIKNSTMIQESVEIDKESQDNDRRSSSVLIKHSENPDDSRISTKRTKKSMIVEKSVDTDEIPGSQGIDRSSFMSKGNPRLSKRNTKNSTIEEVSETQKDSRISIFGGSMEIEKIPESQEIDRRSSSVLKGNSRISKRRTRDATIEEAAIGEGELPESHEDSKISIRPVKNSTMLEESIEGDKLSETHERNRRSSSVSKKSLRDSKRRTREPTIDEATIEDDELPTFDGKSAKFTSTLKQNVTDKKRRTDSMAPKILPEKSRSQLFENWESSGSEEEEEEEEAIKSHETHNDSHSSSKITKTLSVSIERLSTTKSSRSRRTKEFNETREEGEGKRKSHVKRRSVGSRSRNLVDSAYELPDKERSPSPIITASENESVNGSLLSNRSKRQSSKNQQEDNRNAGKPGNRSISVASKENPADSNVSRNPREIDSKVDRENSTKSRKDLAVENKIMSTKDIANTSAFQQEDSDQSISEELAINSHISNSNLSRKSSRKKGKANDSKRVESRQDRQFYEGIDEEKAHQSHKSNATSLRNSSLLEEQMGATKTAVPISSSQENPNFAESISEAETELAANETSETNIKSLQAEKRFSKSRKSSTQPSVSRTREESDESISEEELNSKSLNQSSKNKSNVSRKNSGRPNVSRLRIESDESISEKESNLNSLNQPKDKSNVSRKNSGRSNVSKQRIESDESISEEESTLKSLNHSKDKSNASRKNSKRLNVSRQRIESDESISEEKSNLKSLNQPPKHKNVEARKSAPLRNVSKQHPNFHESGTEENAEDLENMNPTLDISSNGSNPIDKSKHEDSKTHNKASFSNAENVEGDASTSMPSEAIPLAPVLTKQPQNSSSFLNKSTKTRAQKNITDFFPSKFLQRKDNSKTFDNPASSNNEQLDLVRKQFETRRRQMAIFTAEESSKKKEIPSARRSKNPAKITKLRAKQNAPKEPTKPSKVVDKAYIVNGRVYKRPKLPRPKPWVTDRLYRHLWKQLEPKYAMRTRIKSEHFVEQLSEVVALTIRRKKYDSYKAEVDALMKEMARLNIIKTRNDFYDFCYDFLPYDFRVKVTPMILPGSIRNIPYDPTTLHTPILPGS